MDRAVLKKALFYLTLSFGKNKIVNSFVLAKRQVFNGTVCIHYEPGGKSGSAQT